MEAWKLGSLEAWKTGMMGYSLVDAGTRELVVRHGIIRIVVASFLTECLRVNWVKGCECFHYYPGRWRLCD